MKKVCVAAAATAIATSAFTAPSAQAQSAFDLQALSSQFVDELGRPTDHTVSRIQEFANQPWVPEDVENMLRTATMFWAGTGELGGPPMPDDAPAFTQFYWPTVSSNCMGPGLHSTASAIAVPGPTADVVPQPGAGETTFIFTALGTPPAAQDQGEMDVYWFNTDTYEYGVTPLGNNGINPEGPSTLSGRAATGSGTVIAVVAGSVHTTTNNCSFAPTAALFNVR